MVAPTWSLSRNRFDPNSKSVLRNTTFRCLYLTGHQSVRCLSRERILVNAFLLQHVFRPGRHRKGTSTPPPRFFGLPINGQLDVTAWRAARVPYDRSRSGPLDNPACRILFHDWMDVRLSVAVLSPSLTLHPLVVTWSPSPPYSFGVHSKLATRCRYVILLAPHQRLAILFVIVAGDRSGSPLPRLSGSP